MDNDGDERELHVLVLDSDEYVLPAPVDGGELHGEFHEFRGFLAWALVLVVAVDDDED
jgi:hypothetical protein